MDAVKKGKNAKYQGPGTEVKPKDDSSLKQHGGEGQGVPSDDGKKLSYFVGNSEFRGPGSKL